MKLSDYVIEFLATRGVRDVFLVSGGGIMHLLDSIGKNAKITYYCNYHEQACAASAEGHARVTNKIGVCLATTGPGAANALSGIMGAWVDSIPVLVISGQVKKELIADYAQLRQLGPQEANVLGMAKHVTKYAVCVRDPGMIAYALELAFHKATTGRPGPAWVEIPLDVQASEIVPDSLIHYTHPEAGIGLSSTEIGDAATCVIQWMQSSRRPLFVCGNGIHLAGARELLDRLLSQTQLPVALPLTAKDIVPEDHPMQVGIFGVTGQRRANFAVQNSDCIISLGAGLNIQKIGFNVAGFAPKAKKIVVDIDDSQLQYQALKPDLAIQCDVYDFLEEVLRQLPSSHYNPSPKWIEACRTWKRNYPLVIDEFFVDREHVNSYVFMDKLSDLLESDDVLVTGNALDTHSYYQVFKVKRGQRTMNSGWGAMGWCLPLSVGACIGSGKRRTICVTGDGSIQMNVQELLTIGANRLPIKIFVFNNQGYSNIRATQASFFEGRFVGADANSGVANPDFRKLAQAYRLDYCQIRNNDELLDGITRTISTAGPMLCEVNISAEQGVTPKASAFKTPDGKIQSRPLEDMSPPLPREEIWHNMHLFDDEGAL